MDKKWIAGMAGLFDPASIKRIQELAEKIPEESLLRSNLAEYISGVLRGIVETHAEKFSNTSSVVIKKLGDFSGFLSTVLAQTKGKTTKQDLLKDFLAQALERLRIAEDPQKEFEKIKEEIALFNQIMKVAYPETEPSSPVLEGFNRSLEKIRDKLKATEV